MTKSPERQREERMARMLLIVMLALAPVLAAVLVWTFGFDVHPHRIGFACILTGCSLVVGLGFTWLTYYIRMTAARKL
jgi:cation transporter-like permease